MLEATAIGLAWVACQGDTSRLPLITQMTYDSADKFVRGSLIALAFGLALLGLRMVVISLSYTKHSSSGALSPEVEAMISLEHQDRASRANGLQFTATVLGLVVCLALILAASLIGFAVWYLVP